jgi:hypothetical protein
MTDQVKSALRELEPELRAPTGWGPQALRLADRLKEVRKLLAEQETHWISVSEARRLLGASSKDTVTTLVQMGLLKSRTLPNGRMQVPLDDVLRERQAWEELSAFGGEDLTEEELEMMHQAQPGTNPWERNQATSPQ